MKHLNSLIETARIQARKSVCHFKHGAVLAISSGHIVSVGHNNWLRHAEENVLRKIPKFVDAKDLILVVVRVNGSDDLRNSEPCEKCSRLIKRTGISQVFHS